MGPLTIYYEDMLVGKRFVSEPRTLKSTEIDSFAKLTGDMNRLHVDEDYAKRTIFRGRIAHGLLILSMATGLWFDMNLTRDSVVALLAIKSVTFRAPVHPGDRFHLVSTVRSRRPSQSKPDAGIVTLHDVIEDENGNRILDFERVLLVNRAPKG